MPDTYPNLFWREADENIILAKNPPN